MKYNIVQCWTNILLLNLRTDSVIDSIRQSFVNMANYLSSLESQCKPASQPASQASIHLTI